jgi:hypothetical protein
MQRVFNVLALSSFVLSATLIGGAGYLLLNKDAMIEEAKKGVVKAATDAVANALPGMIDAAMPELPEVTGGALPVPGL